MRAHSPSSISRGLAAVFLGWLAPLQPVSARTDTPSFPTARKPHFGRSPEFIRGEVAAAMREAC
jgi:hypothetical protein